MIVRLLFYILRWKLYSSQFFFFFYVDFYNFSILHIRLRELQNFSSSHSRRHISLKNKAFTFSVAALVLLQCSLPPHFSLSRILQSHFLPILWTILETFLCPSCFFTLNKWPLESTRFNNIKQVIYSNFFINYNKLSPRTLLTMLK